MGRTDERLVEFEKRYTELESYLFEERAHVSNLLQHRHAKKQYVLENAALLKQLAKALDGMKLAFGENLDGTGMGIGGKSRNKSLDLNENSAIEHLEARIRKLQRENEPLIQMTNELYRSVSKLTDDYEKCMNAMSRKLLALSSAR